MRPILEYIQRWKNEAFDPIVFSATIVFLALSITLNYSLDLANRMADSGNAILIRFLLFLPFYGIAYFFPLLLDFKKNGIPRVENRVLAYSFFFLAILVPSLDSAISLPPNFIIANFPRLTVLFVKKTGDNLLQAVTLILPVLLFWFFLDRKKFRNPYGFQTRGFKFRPYLVFLLIMLFPIIIVSFFPDFRLMYPRFRTFFAARYFEVSPAIPVIAFEFVYGLAYIATEFFYRGFLILAPARFLGMRAVLPAASLYCYIHFQKPLLETIGSFPGGLLLGIISAATTSIYGGIFVHLGIAWFMEFVGHIQIMFFGDPLMKQIKM